MEENWNIIKKYRSRKRKVENKERINEIRRKKKMSQEVIRVRSNEEKKSEEQQKKHEREKEHKTVKEQNPMEEEGSSKSKRRKIEKMEESKGEMKYKERNMDIAQKRKKTRGKQQKKRKQKHALMMETKDSKKRNRKEMGSNFEKDVNKQKEQIQTANETMRIAELGKKYRKGTWYSAGLLGYWYNNQLYSTSMLFCCTLLVENSAVQKWWRTRLGCAVLAERSAGLCSTGGELGWAAQNWLKTLLGCTVLVENSPVLY